MESCHLNTSESRPPARGHPSPKPRASPSSSARSFGPLPSSNGGVPSQIPRPGHPTHTPAAPKPRDTPHRPLPTAQPSPAQQPSLIARCPLHPARGYPPPPYSSPPAPGRVFPSRPGAPRRLGSPHGLAARPHPPAGTSPPGLAVIIAAGPHRLLRAEGDGDEVPSRRRRRGGSS